MRRVPRYIEEQRNRGWRAVSTEFLLQTAGRPIGRQRVINEKDRTQPVFTEIEAKHKGKIAISSHSRHVHRLLSRSAVRIVD